MSCWQKSVQSQRKDSNITNFFYPQFYEQWVYVHWSNSRKLQFWKEFIPLQFLFAEFLSIFYVRFRAQERPVQPPSRPTAPPFAQAINPSFTRKAKVLYDYDAMDKTELSLLADEVLLITSTQLKWFEIIDFLFSLEKTG